MDMEILGWPKSSFGLKVKLKDSFSPITLLNNIFTVLFHYFLPSFGQLHNSIFPKLFIFLSKEHFEPNPWCVEMFSKCWLYY